MDSEYIFHDRMSMNWFGINHDRMSMKPDIAGIFF